MAKFTDTKSEPWTVHVSLSKARQLATVLGCDVFNVQDLTALSDSLGVRLEYLFHLCTERADELEVDDLDAFAARLQDERVATEASDALQEALLAFFRRLGQTHLALITEKSLQLMRQQRIDACSPEMIAQLDQRLGLAPPSNGAPITSKQRKRRKKVGAQS